MAICCNFSNNPVLSVKELQILTHRIQVGLFYYNFQLKFITMKKVAIIIACLWITSICQSQNWQIEVGSNLPFYPIMQSDPNYTGRHFEISQNYNEYGEIRILRRFNKHLSAGIFVGYERKVINSFLQVLNPPGFFAQPHQRIFVPVGLITRFHFDESINEFLKSKNEKWIGYIQGGLYVLAGKDKLLTEPRNGPIQINYPNNIYGNVYHVFNTGFGYNITKKFYTAAEFGVGALHSAHLTVGFRL